MASSHITILYIIFFFFVVFLANIVSFKSFYRREDTGTEKRSSCILGITEQTVKAGVQNACLPKVSARPSKISNVEIYRMPLMGGSVLGVANSGESQSLGADSS